MSLGCFRLMQIFGLQPKDVGLKTIGLNFDTDISKVRLSYEKT